MSDEIPDTAFNLHGYGTVPGSARGLQYRYKPVRNGSNRTDMWGRAWFTGLPSLRNLFTFTISCTDIQPPGFASLSIGDDVTFDGLPWTQRASDALFLPVAAGSTPVYTDADGEPLPDATGAAWCEWCPTASAKIDDFDAEHSEWEATVRWSLTLLMSKVVT